MFLGNVVFLSSSCYRS